MPSLPDASRWGGEQRADLVTAQHPPAVRTRDRGGAPVGVGVVGHDQVRAALLGEGHREVHRARLLGVRERDGREVGVRLLLLGDDARGREARGLQDLRDRRAADAVQRRVDDVEVAGPVGRQAGDGVEVAVDDVLAQRGAGVAAGHVGQCAHRGDPGGDVGVGRGHDLAAVAEVDLVAVVLRRVVAGGHHHAGHAAELADREGQKGSGQRTREDVSLQPGAGHDLGGVAREDVGVVAGVVPDHHAGAPGGAVVLQVGGEAGGGAGDDDTVHPVRARSEGAAQAGVSRTPGCRRSGRRGRWRRRHRPPPR